jgi:uncharacterized protein
MAREGHAPGRSAQLLEKVRARLPVVLHGVSLSIGSADSLDRGYLARLRELIHRIEPAWVSDHLCWTGVDGENLHDLMPLPYTHEALTHVVDRISAVQDTLGRRILIENVSSYVEFAHSEMQEWEFVREVLERADCGLLLDVNNIYVSSVNHGFDPVKYLRAIPANRVAQIHLAGHTRKDGYLIDTHDHPVCPEVWDLYRLAVREFGLVSAMIERDAEIPDWDTLDAEVRMIGRIRDEERAIDADSARVSAPI